ncbi:Lrp/AsnC family transcriptional regulator [Desulfotalea psychrophila]|uniref:Related to transcription regulator (AsnC-family) n=1 Tax=Desulfotalea psychrophila (strain LSv54 / DSM 12343) TaxID=177439 RepID=Q6ANT7_DESPS|nr:Lrp/AsnC family transcriptional regulator [Desulfotalea psychrophila]CAG35987.1 related to transcription regulator (AsnC-family) [Desulfotalea psychrophila LSv54]
MHLDKTDRKILNILQGNGRIRNSKLAAEIGISPPAMLERVKRLELSGIITGFTAQVDRDKVGYGLLAIIIVSVNLHQVSSLTAVKEKLKALDYVLECYQLTGDVDFMLKVAVKDMQTYTTFVNTQLSDIPGIQNVKTSFVLETLKSNNAITLAIDE